MSQQHSQSLDHKHNEKDDAAKVDEEERLVLMDIQVHWEEMRKDVAEAYTDEDVEASAER